MILLFFSALLMSSMYTTFTIVTRLQCANRIVINTPRYLFEQSISLLDDTDLHFDKTTLSKVLNNYYQNELSRYVSDISIELYFYNQEDSSICTSDSCNAVEVEISANCVFSIRFSRTIFYEIHKGARYGL